MRSADCINVSEANKYHFNVTFVPNFYPEDRGGINLRNVDGYLRDYMMSNAEVSL
jgi:hypothetical protein